MLDISNLDQLSRQLVEVKKALESLDGDIGSISIDPGNPASVQAAIQRIESIIDDKLGPYASNPIIGPLSAKLKVQHRESILAQTAAER
ncbi:MAG: hypothetical protein A3F78_03825 [Burkholderiales bacterium RIFCSPLOWO2_12_FULL_61_40]|nr:MAG: hypothetical protein A3F78_03825 [Burkholderiales bacterium RIFCSPLOWO2_12_FULL_61_40]